MKKTKSVGQKTPTNIFHTDFIKKMFPDCQFIHIIRDGRDVVASFKKRWGSKTIFYGMNQWNRSINLLPTLREKYSNDELLEYGANLGIISEEEIRNHLLRLSNPVYSKNSFMYELGYKLIRNKYGAVPSVKNFQNLLTNPILPSDLI